MGKSPELSKERIFVSEKLWSTFNALVGIHGRLAILVHYGLNDKKNPDWKQDKLMIRFAKYVISDEDWKEIQEMKLSGFRALAERIRQEFLKEAKKTMRGTEQFSETLEDYHGVVTQQEIVAYEERSKRAVCK